MIFYRSHSSSGEIRILQSYCTHIILPGTTHSTSTYVIGPSTGTRIGGEPLMSVTVEIDIAHVTHGAIVPCIGSMA